MQTVRPAANSARPRHPFADTLSAPPPSRHSDHVGTLLYSDPHWKAGAEHTAAFDIFSAGIVLFELRLGASTRMGRAVALSALREAGAQMPEGFEERAPREAALVRQMIASPATSRPSAAELLQRLPAEYSPGAAAAVASVRAVSHERGCGLPSRERWQAVVAAGEAPTADEVGALAECWPALLRSVPPDEPPLPLSEVREDAGPSSS